MFDAILILLVIEFGALEFGLHLSYSVGLVGDCVFQEAVLLIFALLGQHEGAEFFKLRFEIVGILLFLKIAQLAVFHIRYYY